MEEGGKSTESNHMKHPMDDSNSPPIPRTVKGKVYGRFLTTDKGPRTKYIANKYPRPANYTILYIWIVYTNSTLCITLL